MPVELRCGPVVRSTNRTSTVLFVEVSEPTRVDVELWPTADRWRSMQPQIFSALTVQVGDGHYAWVACRWLWPDTEYGYQLTARHRNGTVDLLWPNEASASPSVLRTMPTSAFTSVKLAYGSCRQGCSPTDSKTIEGDNHEEGVGVDALALYAARLQRQSPDRALSWPRLLILMGDQIYADHLSTAMQQRLGRNEVHSLPEFAALYRESWTSDVRIRWLLSSVPSLMIFDDHEIVDDWNISAAWVSRNAGEIARFADGLLAYWLYQGAGNLAPREWSSDERMRPLIARRRGVDATRPLRHLMRQLVLRERDAHWSHAADIAGSRVVFIDSRVHRKLEGERLIVDDPAWQRVTRLAQTGSARRTLLVAPGPPFVPYFLHDALSWVADKVENDPDFIERLSTAGRGGALASLAGGVLGFIVGGPAGAAFGATLSGAGGAGVGFASEEIIETQLDKGIEDNDVELWPAFPSSFDRLVGLLGDLALQGRRPCVLTGDVHFSYVMQGRLGLQAAGRPFTQLTLSGFQRRVSSEKEDLAKSMLAGDLAKFGIALDLAEFSGVYYQPEFVRQQRRRVAWSPVNDRGVAVGHTDTDEYLFFGNFVGELTVAGSQATYAHFQSDGLAPAPPDIPGLAGVVA